MAKKAKGKKSVGKIVALVISVLLVTALCGGVAYVAMQWSKVQTEELSAKNLSINREIEHDSGYLNVALFGLDSRDQSLGTGNRSDAMMVASLNKATGEIRIVSVYRDTLLELGDGSYNKANAAYSFGDAEAATALLNRNLDLDLQKYVTVNWKALIDMIDGVGGIELVVKKEEVDWINGYILEISENTGIKPTGVHAGRHKLNGIQATAYARVRYTEGGDFTRTERQRRVMTKLAEKLRKCKVKKLTKLIDKVFPQVKTNFTLKEVLSYVRKVRKYAVGETMGFPDKTSFTNLEGIGSCVIADEFASDVEKVHKFLFGDSAGYTASEVIKGIAAKIQEYKGKGSATDTYNDNYDQTYTNSPNYNNQQYYQQYNYNNNNNTNNTNTNTNTDTTGGAGTGGGTDTGGGGAGTGGDQSGGQQQQGGGANQNTQNTGQ